MTGTNEPIIRRLVEEVVNRGNSGLLTKLMAANHVGRDCLGEHHGPAGVRVVVNEYRTAFPDLAVTIEDLIAAGDTVTWHFTLRGTHAGPSMGIPRPSGRWPRPESQSIAWRTAGSSRAGAASTPLACCARWAPNR